MTRMAPPANTKRESSHEAPWNSTTADITVGKDILELLSSAMYIDPMTIYREYLQNAADAIDEAREAGVLSKSARGTVAISIDDDARIVRIRDNGVGVPSRNFARRLTALGASGKRGGGARGFRGVGRLAGLAYCQELIFRSRAQGELHISEMRWDCRKLKTILLSANAATDLQSVVKEVVSIRKLPAGDDADHFFEVELKSIIRHKNDRLLNPAAVADYVAQVAPAPFHPDFRFAGDIVAALRPHVPLADLHVTVTGLNEPVFRPLRNELILSETETDSFADVQIFDLPGLDGRPAAIGWILHHGYSGAIPHSNLVKGLRLRAGNIQVGENALLEELFTEPRFNSWSVGEVHVLDARVVPNGRRDHFEQNTHYNNLLNQIAPYAREISKRCRTSSIQRKHLRDFEMHHQVASEKIQIISQATLPTSQREELARGAERAIASMEKIAHMDGLDFGADQQLVPRVKAVKARLNQAIGNAVEQSPLAALPRAKRKMYEHLFSLIYECSANRVAAKSLVDRIVERVTSSVSTQAS
jgi:histidine kinase/DNA gyrase B/HSP90-like ATPase